MGKEWGMEVGFEGGGDIKGEQKNKEPAKKEKYKMVPGGSKTRPTTLTSSFRTPRALSSLFFIFSAFRYAGHFRRRLMHKFATETA